jgi:hypothetical protein
MLEMYIRKINKSAVGDHCVTIPDYILWDQDIPDDAIRLLMYVISLKLPAKDCLTIVKDSCNLSTDSIIRSVSTLCKHGIFVKNVCEWDGSKSFSADEKREKFFTMMFKDHEFIAEYMQRKNNKEEK